MQPETDYALYEVTKDLEDFTFNIREVDIRQSFLGSKPFRKSHRRPNLPAYSGTFTDPHFDFSVKGFTDPKGNQFVKRRIYQLYDVDLPIFPPKAKETFIECESFYPTFVTQFSMIDEEYVKTLIFTKQITNKGYYEYFVRRNGEYYVDFIDDYIPVQGAKQLPAWGFGLKAPWQLILMKAWIKEKKGIEGVLNARPFEFIEAFGMPGYRALSLKKQIDYLNVSKIQQSSKEEKERKIPINIPGFITVGKTRDNPKVSELGLQRNRGGYRIIPVDSKNKSFIGKESSFQSNGSRINEGENNLYKVKSSLITNWCGEYSVANKDSKLLKEYKSNVHELNLEKEFLATYKEISQVFSKFYITPQYSSKYDSGNMLQDSINVKIKKDRSSYIFYLEVKNQKFININIDLPINSMINKDNKESKEKHDKIRYASIKYFLAKQNADGGDRDKQLCKFKCYDIEYVKGYHHSCNRFLDIEPGKYFLYVKIEARLNEPVTQFSININTNATINKFELVQNIPDIQVSELIKHTLFNHAMRYALKVDIHKNKKDLLAYLGNFFDQIGFGYVVIQASPNFQTEIAMNVNRENLLKYEIQVSKETDDGRSELKEIVKIAKPDSRKIVVLERKVRENFGRHVFPPPGTVDFYDIA